MDGQLSNLVDLLTVEDSFLIKGRGLVLIPDFSVPDNWKNKVDTVVLKEPDGQQISITAQFNLTHFNISDATLPADRRWRVVVMLPELQRKLPVGSKLLVSAETRNALVQLHGNSML